MLLLEAGVVCALISSVVPFPEKQVPILKDEVMDSLKKLDAKKELEVKQKETLNAKGFKDAQSLDSPQKPQEMPHAQEDLEHGDNHPHFPNHDHDEDENEETVHAHEDEDDEEDEAIEEEIKQATERGNVSTTTKQPENDDDYEATMCTKEAACFSDSDCYGGQCIGLGVNHCACLSCNTGAVCSGKHGCGGLKGACNRATSRCDCEGAFKKHGYTSLGSALYDLCNVRYCVPNTDSCLGMPCNPGTCICPK
uniref:Chondroitin proteoglycan 3 n=1 Tax=Syphacia muris TaxID=451379 RepID=A0A0N5AHN2_9BILA